MRRALSAPSHRVSEFVTQPVRLRTRVPIRTIGITAVSFNRRLTGWIRKSLTRSCATTTR